MINFVVAGLVLRDFVLGVRLSFKPCWHCSHLFGVARNTHTATLPVPARLKSRGESIKRHRLRVKKRPTAIGPPELDAGEGIQGDAPGESGQGHNGCTDDRIGPVR